MVVRGDKTTHPLSSVDEFCETRKPVAALGHSRNLYF